VSAPLAPIGADAVHIVVDVQRLFAEDTGWQVPTLDAILPNIHRLIDHRPARSLYTRFVTPSGSEAARGIWQRFYRHWPQVTKENISPDLFDLVAPLAAKALPEAQIDKDGFSSYTGAAFAPALDRLGCGMLVLSGVETDVCVFATALEAVDRGFRVVIATDAVTSFSPAAHRATLEHVLPRFEHLIDLAPTEAILAAWK
jgi:nicotinamidase-related amidase